MGKPDASDAQRETLDTSGFRNSSKNTPPPSYVEQDSNVQDTTAAFSNLNLNASGTPTADQCIAHLKLLEAFHQLREDIALKDGLFGISDSFADTKVTAQEKAELLVKIREKRWAVYVARAAKRFEKWWTEYIEPYGQMLKQAEIPATFVQKLHIGNWLDFDCDNLPPLGKKTDSPPIETAAPLTSHRRHHGMACISAQSQRLSGGLYPLWQAEVLEDRLTLVSCQFMHKQ